MAIDWNCVKRYSAPVPFGNTREYATTSIPGAGEKWKSIVWVASFVTYRIGISPSAVERIQRSGSTSGRMARQKPTAQRGKFSGSATNAKTRLAGALIMTVRVSERVVLVWRALPGIGGLFRVDARRSTFGR